VIEKMRGARDVLASLDPYERPGLEELYELGGELEDVLLLLRRAVKLGMRPSVAELDEASNVEDPRDAPVYDDESQHPQDRLRVAWLRLSELDRCLDNAAGLTSKYYGAISHIGPRPGTADSEDE